MTTMRDVLGMCEAAKAEKTTDPRVDSDRMADAFDAIDKLMAVLDKLSDEPTPKEFFAVAVAADRLSVAARAAAGK
jgi:hypothetical protein